MNRKNSSLPHLWWTGYTLLALAVVGCSKPTPPDPRLQPPKVVVYKTEAASSKVRKFTGTVEARVQSDLGFRVGGKIQERCVDAGQRVQKGQPLMRLDPADLDLSASAQQANVEAAHARYIQAKADEARMAKLVKSDVISPQDYDRVRAAMDSAKADLAAFEAQAKVSANSSGYAVLVADADGVIVRTLSEPGQVVTPGQTVVQLAHDGPREAVINLPEDVRPDLGSTATARLYGQDKNFRATLRQLSDSADPDTRTYEARYVLEGDAASSPLGSTITVAVTSAASPGNEPIKVPVGAVYDQGIGPGVWKIDDGNKVTFCPVGIVSFGKEDVVVSGRLEAGESIVALGTHLLHEGQLVNTSTEAQISHGKL